MRQLAQAILATFLLPASCGGGECKYEDTAGTCTITAVGGADGATFDFAPEGASAPSTSGSFGYVVDSRGALVEGPSAACLAANHVTVGAALACSMRTESGGTCNPQPWWTIPSFDNSASGCP